MPCYEHGWLHPAEDCPVCRKPEVDLKKALAVYNAVKHELELEEAGDGDDPRHQMKSIRRVYYEE